MLYTCSASRDYPQARDVHIRVYRWRREAAISVSKHDSDPMPASPDDSAYIITGTRFAQRRTHVRTCSKTMSFEFTPPREPVMRARRGRQHLLLRGKHTRIYSSPLCSGSASSLFGEREIKERKKEQSEEFPVMQTEPLAVSISMASVVDVHACLARGCVTLASYSTPLEKGRGRPTPYRFDLICDADVQFSRERSFGTCLVVSHDGSFAEMFHFPLL